jgi:DNA-binding NarL/FixJ family response regulator
MNKGDDRMNKELEKEKPIKKETKKRECLPDFDTLREIDLSKHFKKRDNASYVNWAVIKQVLHDNGAKKVYFEPMQQTNGSSLIMTEKAFLDSKENTNQVYETRIKIVIDDLEFEMQGPVMNGANPVKDNSMSQQRLWNAQTRLFVKGVAIRTGLGFDLWSNIEKEEEDQNEEDLSVHNILKIQERVQQLLTKKMKLGLSEREIANQLKLNEKQLETYMQFYKRAYNLEKALEKVDKE